jgi:hypothetical protein
LVIPLRKNTCAAAKPRSLQGQLREDSFDDDLLRNQDISFNTRRR